MTTVDVAASWKFGSTVTVLRQYTHRGDGADDTEYESLHGVHDTTGTLGCVDLRGWV